MTPNVFNIAAVGGVAVLLTQPDPQFYVLCGVLITSTAGLITAYMRSKSEERRHQWDKEDRERFRESLKGEVAKVANIAAATKDDIRSDIAQNTAINVEALAAANGVNEKIAKLAARGITDA